MTTTQMKTVSKDPSVYSRRVKHGQDVVYVGAPTKWGNPFVVGRDGNQEECVEMYKAYIVTHPWIADMAKKELKGKNLECWCSPKPCHADVLLELANE